MVLGISYIQRICYKIFTMTLNSLLVALNKSQRLKSTCSPIFSILKLFINKHVRITCKTSYCKKQAVWYLVIFYLLQTFYTQTFAAKALFHFSKKFILKDRLRITYLIVLFDDWHDEAV